MTDHRFIAALPTPRPAGFTPSLDLQRRATCTCGWQADRDSRDPNGARDVWLDDHLAAA